MLRPARTLFLFCLILFVFAICSTSSLQAQTFTVIHSFTGGPDGGSPFTGLAMDAGGSLYGTAIYGGTNGLGLVFKIKRSGADWIETPLYSFSANETGGMPLTLPTFGPGGALYTATSGQFPQCCGTVLRLQPSGSAPRSVAPPWNGNVLHQFTGPDGKYLQGNLTFDQAGNIYGVGEEGGTTGLGVIYELSRSGSEWNETVLYDVQGTSDGAYPTSGLSFDSSGNLYGVMMSAGPHNCGTIYKLSPSGSAWTESTVYAFTCGSDGSEPYGGLLRDHAGNLYGTTVWGPNGGGTVFELSPTGGGWTFQTIYTFTDNSHPFAALISDASGNLYGTTSTGGAFGDGRVYQLVPPPGGQGSWTFHSLHVFTSGSDGTSPVGALVMDSSGNLYGTNQAGGSSGFGVAFEITP